MIELVLFTILSSTVSAGIWSDDELPAKPQNLEDKEGCFINEISDVVPFGKMIHIPGYCYIMQCTTEKIIYLSCGVVLTDDIECDFKYIRYGKSYPECCEHINCLQKYLPKSIRKGVFTSGNPLRPRKPYGRELKSRASKNHYFD